MARRLKNVARRNTGPLRSAYSAVRAGMNAAIALKNAHTAYKNSRIRRNKLKTKTQEFSGGLVKCYNQKVQNKRRTRTQKRFVKNVKKAILEDVPRQTSLTSYGWRLPQNISNNTGIFSECWWWQFALDYVNNDYVDAQVCPSAYLLNGNDLPNATATPFCYVNTGAGANTGGSTVVPATSLQESIYNDTSPNMISGNGSLEKMYSSMQVTLKNVSKIAYVVEIFTVRPRSRKTMDIRKDDIQAYSVWHGALDAYRIGLANYPANGNPAITGTLGAASTAIANSQASQFLNSSLTDSVLFAQNYKITKRCKVYLAAGGMLQKHLVHKNMRRFNTRYLYDTKEDRGTEYLIFKAYPEPMSSPGNAGAEAPSIVYENQLLSPLIGYVGWRYTYKQIQDPTTRIIQHYGGGVPVSASQYVPGGQAANTHYTT